ncbi:MAG: hypothetical protein ACJ74U_20260 [Jatrophihabitantaceae bacterium]
MLEVFGQKGGPGLAVDRSEDGDALIGAADQELLEEALVGKSPDVGLSDAVDLLDSVM